MRAVSSMTIRSVHSAMSVPPATQKPCTLVTTGLSLWKRAMKPRGAGPPRPAQHTMGVAALARSPSAYHARCGSSSGSRPRGPTRCSARCSRPATRHTHTYTHHRTPPPRASGTPALVSTVDTAYHTQQVERRPLGSGAGGGDVAGAALGAHHEVVPTAKALTVARERNDAHNRVEVGALDAQLQLPTSPPPSTSSQPRTAPYDPRTGACGR
jgi:hypothetical protein